MATFATNIITKAGKDIIAHATASNPIIYTGALCLEAYVPASSLVNFDIPQGIVGKIDGVVVSASATGNTARIIAGFGNQPSEKVIKTVVVYGRLSDATPPTDHCIFARSDESASIRIPSTAEASVQVQVALDAIVEDDGSATITSGNYASVGDLERFVSAHKAGQPTVGTAQNVFGKKAFTDGIKTDTVDSVSGAGVTVKDDLLADENTRCIGSAGTPFSRIYAYTGYHNSLEAIPDSPEISLRSHLIPYDGGILLLGTSYAPFANIYSKVITVDSVACNSITATGSNTTIGTSATSFKYGYIQGIYAQNIAPKGTSTSVGTQTQPFGDIYAGEFHGVMPYPYKSNGEVIVEPGAIICVKLPSSIVGAGGAYAGELITIPEGTSLYCTNLDGSFDGQVIHTTGIYTLLSNVPAAGGAALMMKVYDD